MSALYEEGTHPRAVPEIENALSCQGAFSCKEEHFQPLRGQALCITQLYLREWLFALDCISSMAKGGVQAHHHKGIRRIRRKEMEGDTEEDAEDREDDNAHNHQNDNETENCVDDGLVSLLSEFLWPGSRNGRRLLQRKHELDASMQRHVLQRSELAQKAVAGKSREEINEDIDTELWRVGQLEQKSKTKKTEEEEKVKEKKEGALEKDKEKERDEEEEDDVGGFGARCAKGADKTHRKKPVSSREEYRVMKEDIEALFGGTGMDEKNILSSLEENERLDRRKQQQKQRKERMHVMKEDIQRSAEAGKRRLREDVRAVREEMSNGGGGMHRDQLMGFFADEESRRRFKEDALHMRQALSEDLDRDMVVLEDEVGEMKRELNDQRNVALY